MLTDITLLAALYLCQPSTRAALVEWLSVEQGALEDGRVRLWNSVVYVRFSCGDVLVLESFTESAVRSIESGVIGVVLTRPPQKLVAMYLDNAGCRWAVLGDGFAAFCCNQDTAATTFKTL